MQKNTQNLNRIGGRGTMLADKLENLDLTTADKAQSRAVSILDDDPSVVKSTSRLLASAGWIVKAFTDPMDFLRHAARFQPKVVVLDILMPLMNGLEVQKRLQTIAPQSRVIILTSKDDPAVRAKAAQQGASAFFTKPIGDDEFLAGIESAFSES
jgi:FixJ family two-component response regulator